MSKAIKKRFIAGATCPRCHEMDKVRAWKEEDGAEFLECVGCGLQQSFTEFAKTQQEKNTLQEHEQVIRFFDPDNP